MTNKRIVFYSILLITIVSGCVSIPKSPSELVGTSAITIKYCYQDDPEKVKQRIQAFMEKCYHPVVIWGVRIPGNIEWEILHEKLDEKDRYSVSNDLGYPFSVEVTPNTDGCPSNVIMYGITTFWHRFMERVDMAAKGEKVNCPL